MEPDTKPAIESVLKPALVPEQRMVQLEDIEWRASGAGGGEIITRGHAAVFNQWSLDLGGFRERIMPGFFDKVLADNPDVWLNWDHDSRWTLARTTNKTLELRTDPRGLHYYAKIAPTSYASDLRILMERGDINQASFKFLVADGGDEWRIVEENGVEIVERDLIRCGGLFDVTITAEGAYPQTDSQLVAHMRSRVKAEIAEGHLPESAARAIPEIVAPDEPVDEPESQPEGLDEDEQRTPAPETVEDTSTPVEVEETRNTGREADLRAMRTEIELAKRRLLDAENEGNR